MSDYSPVLHLVTFHNPYPNCVSLKLDTMGSQSSSGQIMLQLQGHFNEQEKDLLNGHLKFGLKGGILSLELENGEIIYPEPLLEDWAQLQTQSSVNPSWELTPKTGASILKIDNITVPFAIIQPQTEPLYLTVTLKVTPQNLSITNAEGLWRHDIHPNQHAILERVLAQFLYKNRLSSHLCRLVFSSNKGTHQATLEDYPSQELDSHELAQLHQRIEQLYAANTHNLAELIKLAHFNPLTDLAGGNFLAAELSAVELSGANLTQTNFRGANLTDAELSEAILNYCKFSGADLSGAYLGNAQLVKADFHRASLAVANLIGANLTEANLREANLIDANLSGATVKDAKFGENPGMTPELEQSLHERGAIFVHNP